MARKELTRSKAEEYFISSKKRKSQILDTLCEDTGWSRDNARRQLKGHMEEKIVTPRKPRAPKYSGRARQILTNIWALSGTSCGQYLVVQMKDGLIERLIKNKELREDLNNKGRLVLLRDPVIDEVRAMSSATIDRYLKLVKKRFEPTSKSTTKRSNYPLRNEIPFGKSYALAKGVGYLSTDTVAHCGHRLKGDHLWTLNSTDVLVGWTETITIKNRARKWIIEGHDEILGNFPYPIVAINYDGGSEFINYEMVDYAKLHHYQMTRSRPYHSNDNAHVEQKNYEIVRKNAFRYRYDGDDAQSVLNELWRHVNLRKNYLVPTRKCIGHTKTKSGRTRGIYDKPQTPYKRLMERKDIPKKTKEELSTTFKGLNDAEITRNIIKLQKQLLELAVDADMLEYADKMIEAVKAA